MTNFKKVASEVIREIREDWGSLVEKKVSNWMFSNFGQKDYDFFVTLQKS